MPSMKKSTMKTGQDGAKATALLKRLSTKIAPNRTGFLPILKYKEQRQKYKYIGGC